ncbi:hypothetical protein ACIPL1_18360 [Pseudomonas sp. NPDC090202]|uniref:hypothetical protein n=1 Tax=unclassified Pseudomonas TaxID=196821 RepID=UPI0038209B7F
MGKRILSAIFATLLLGGPASLALAEDEVAKSVKQDNSEIDKAIDHEAKEFDQKPHKNREDADDELKHEEGELDKPGKPVDGGSKKRP